VRYRDADVELEVVDGGSSHRRRGHDLGGGGHGLVGMRERVRVFGGELITGRRRGGGFEVRARIPLDTGLDRPEAERLHQNAGLDAPRR
jgi:signal transduction histidine kinase